MFKDSKAALQEMKRKLQYGSKELAYNLQFADRKTLGITVTPEMEVEVKAPIDAEVGEIEKKIRKRASWIFKQKSFFLSFHPRMPSKRFVSGESHLYLGRQYKLKVSEGKKNSVRFDGRSLLLTHKPKSKAKMILGNWYRMKAKEVFAEVAEPLIVRFEKYNVKPTSIFLQAMATRWGSCTHSGKLILNPELIKAPKKCIEYVILHELCHLVHKNHTATFFKLQGEEMPDWEKWKEKLERLMA